MNEAAKLREQVLLLRCQIGDRDALEELIERYERPLRYFINRLLDNSDLTEDIFQDTWLTVIGRIYGLKELDAFPAWLYRIARNKVYQQLRTKRNSSVLDESIPAENHAEDDDFSGEDAAIPGVISWTFALAVIYTVATGGSIFGGWLPKRFMNSGMTPNKARKLAMFILALLPLSVLLASRLGQINTWFAVATIAIACSAHQAWSANLFTTVSDMFPKRAVASVTGIGGMAGAVGGVLISRVAGLVLKHFTSLGEVGLGYAILFTICGSAYLVAWVVMHLLVPKYEQVPLGDA